MEMQKENLSFIVLWRQNVLRAAVNNVKVLRSLCNMPDIFFCDFNKILTSTTDIFTSPRYQKSRKPV
jgi:hypothetical protein